MKFTFFSQQARTHELVVIKTLYVIILLIIIFSYGLGGGGSLNLPNDLGKE